MKKIAYIYFTLLLAFGCTNEYLAPGTEPSHGVVYTSEMDFGNRIQINGQLAFGDVSPGIVSRKWTFPADVDILNSDNDTESTESVVKAKFKKPGVFSVKLNQEFKSEAFINGKVRGTTNDTTIVVTVLDTVHLTLKANVLDKSGNIGSNLVIKNLARNEVEAGKTIRLFPTATGEPATLTWTLTGGTPATVTGLSPDFKPVDVKYNKVGLYDLVLVGNRTRPAGGDTITYKEFFKVIPSTDPVTLDAVQAKDGKVALSFSRTMDPTTLNPANFKVSVINKTKSVPVSVTAVALDPNAENVVMLSLSGAIYNDDEIKVSYTKGALATADGVASASFDNQAVSFITNNVLVPSIFDEGFESSASADWPYQWWGAPWDAYKLTVTNDDKHSGGKSAKVELNAKGGMIIGHTVSGAAARFKAEKGKTYEIGFWLKLTSLGANLAGSEDPNIIFFWEPNTNWGAGRYNFTSDTPLNKWTYVKVSNAEFTADGNYQFWVRGFNGNNDKPLTFFMDDITIHEVKLRP